MRGREKKREKIKERVKFSWGPGEERKSLGRETLGKENNFLINDPNKQMIFFFFWLTPCYSELLSLVAHCSMVSKFIR